MFCSGEGSPLDEDAFSAGASGIKKVESSLPKTQKAVRLQERYCEDDSHLECSFCLLGLLVLQTVSNSICLLHTLQRCLAS